MKKLHTIKSWLVILIVSIVFFGCSHTKNITNEQVTNSDTLKNMINARNFVFVAQHVNPIGISRRDLTGDRYDISITKDTLISYLPFFGRGYAAPISPSDVDFDFTSTKFDYTMKETRKGWNITINPKDQNYLKELYFTIFDNGSASLNIISINRSSVSYDGYIARRRIKESKKK